ncbi:MAG: copper transporter, partial [Actinomycetota bacterium]|nr:copper transporter [Actinomycetota bacterium]
GDLSSQLASDIEDALEPSGGELAEVAVVRRPPDLDGLSSELGRGRFAALEDDPAALEDLGERLGFQYATGEGTLLANVRDTLFSRSSGEGGALDGVVLVRAQPGDLSPEDEAAVTAFETGLVQGVADSGVPVVAVERSSAGESSIPFFAPFEAATVDSVDLTSGRVALVFTLLGAEGDFGIKGTANSLLPELLEPGPALGGGAP